MASCRRVSWHICIICINFFPTRIQKGVYFHKAFIGKLAISSKPYELDVQYHVFHGVNTRNGSIYIIKYISWQWWFIEAYIIKATSYFRYFHCTRFHNIFYPVTLFISQETGGLYQIICEKSISWFFSPYFQLFCWQNRIFFKIFKQKSMQVATFGQLWITKFFPKSENHLCPCKA